MNRKNDEAFIKPWRPTPEEHQAIFATNATDAWLSNLPADILRTYQGQWVAARDCQIIASAWSRADVRKKLEGTDTGAVVITRLEKPGRVIYR